MFMSPCSDSMSYSYKICKFSKLKNSTSQNLKARFSSTQNFETKIREFRNLTTQFSHSQAKHYPACTMASQGQLNEHQVIAKIEELIKTIVTSFSESGDCTIKTPTGAIRFHSNSAVTFGLFTLLFSLLLSSPLSLPLLPPI